MKAVLLHEHGGPEVLHYTNTDTPEPGPGEVLLEVKAIAMNRADWWVRNGWPGIKLAYPHIMGADAAGIIAALGPGAEDFGLAVGQRVVLEGTESDETCEYCLAGQTNLCPKFGVRGEHSSGTYAEYILAPVRNVLPVPDGFSLEEAAAASLVYLTAWHSLVERGGLQAGEAVLVVGAGGGVNTASIQIAKLAGAKVYVVGSTDEKLAQAESLGADVLINRNKEDWSKAVFKLTNKRGVDVVVDNVGEATLFSSIRAVRKQGRILVVGNTSGPLAEVDLRYVFFKHLSIIGSTMGTHDTFRTVMRLVFEGKLKSIVDKTFPLKDAQSAHTYFESDDVFGKVVMVP